MQDAPHLKDEHLPVFDCANPPAADGTMARRCIPVQGHIRMTAAAQPFISGAISKTINLPNAASVADIKAAYRLSWELALKANALYRDGWKLSQPLNNGIDDAVVEDQEAVELAREEVAAVAETLAESASTQREPVDKIVERVVERPMRRRLPDTRQSTTHKFNVAGHEGYLTVGLYENGQPGELFVTMAKEGSTIGGLMDSLGTAISVALQYGVPVESLVNKFTHQRFEPAGMTHNPDIPFAKSLVDYIFRWMGMAFIPGYKAANAPRRGGAADERAGAVSDRAAAGAKAGASIADPPRAAAAAIGIGAGESAAAAGPGSGDNGGNGRHQGTDQPLEVRGVDRRRRPTPADTAAGPLLAVSAATTTGHATQGATPATTMMIKEIQADAPACDVCGTITVRNGTCYKCVNCGNSMGCS